MEKEPQKKPKFLTHLAVEENVAASTQNQALCAIVFLYKKVLKDRYFYVGYTKNLTERLHNHNNVNWRLDNPAQKNISKNTARILYVCVINTTLPRKKR